MHRRNDVSINNSEIIAWLFGSTIQSEMDTFSNNEKLYQILKTSKEDLLNSLQAIVLPSVYFYFSEKNDKKIIGNLTAENKAQIFKLFPELKRLVMVRIHHFQSQVENAYKLCLENKSKLQKIFRKNVDYPTRIDVFQGDQHPGISGTVKIFFEEKYIYLKFKENNYEAFVSDFNTTLAHKRRDSVQLQDGFYFQEAWLSTPISKKQKLVYSCGNAIFVAYLLGLADLHYENGIFNNNEIRLIDCENIANTEYVVPDNLYALNNSVLSCGMLPDASFFGTPLSIIKSSNKRTLYKSGSFYEVDHEYLVKKHVSNRVLNNSVLEPMNFKNYSNDVIKSFKDAYRFYLNNERFFKENIKRQLNGKMHRKLIHDTYIYYDVLRNSYQAWLMMDQQRREEYIKSQGNLTTEELAALKDGLVPLIVEKNIYSSQYFEKFSIEDMHIQEKIIDSVINNEIVFKNNPIADKGKIYSSENLKKACETFAESWKSQTFEVMDNTSWVDTVLTGSKEADTMYDFNTTFAPMNIYYGKAGMILFLAKLRKTYRTEQYLKLEENLVKQLITELENYSSDPMSELGILDGVTGMLFAVTLSNTLKISNNFKKNVIKEIFNKLKKTKQLDFTCGIAGLILYLRFEINHNSEPNSIIFFKNILSQSVDFIVSEYHSDSCNWLNPKMHGNILGFAHGNIGIVAMLALANQITLNLDAKRVIKDVTDFYLESYNCINHGWPISNEKDKFVFNWCHGAPGILLGLSLIAMTEEINSDKLIEISRQSFMALKGTKHPSGCLCHGSIGNSLIMKFVNKNIKFNSESTVYNWHLSEVEAYLNCNDINWNSRSFMCGQAGILFFLMHEKKEERVLTC